MAGGGVVLIDVDALAGDLLALKKYLTGGRLFKQVQAAQKRGFARARRADDGYHLAPGDMLFHTQIGVGNRLDGGRRRVKKYLWSF